VKSRTGAAVVPRPLRSALALRAGALAAASAVVLAAGLPGCFGGEDEKRRPPGALAAALSFFPAGSGAVFVIETDARRGPFKRLDELGSRLRRWRALEKELEAELEQQGLDFDRIVRPQLGNPFALAVAENGRRLGAIRVKDRDALIRAARERIAARKAERLDDYKEALVWKERGTRPQALPYSAVLGSDLVLAQTEQDLEEAIDRTGSSNNLAFDKTFSVALASLGRGSLVRGVGDSQRLLENGDSGQAAEARKLPWVRALGIFTLAATVEKRGIEIDFELRTDRLRLSDEQLPLAPGTAAPRLHDRGAAAALALREPERLVRFAERTLAVTDPGRFARYEAGVTQLRSVFGVNVHRDLLARIETLSVASLSATSATFVGTLEPGSGRAFARALDRALPFVQGVLGEFAPGTTIEARGGGARRAWFVKNRGLVIARYAVRRGTLVGSVGFAGLPAPVQGRRLSGASGSLSIRGDPRRIAALVDLLPAIPREALEVFSGLRDLTLSFRTETRALTAKGRIAVGRSR
jgi:hypothetical protein